MNEIQELDVSIAPDGTVSVKVRGVNGDRCLLVTKAIEARLGEVVSRENTLEMDARSEDAADVTQSIG